MDSFANLDKSTVLQDTRHFNDNVINNRKCISILTKVLYLINQVGHRLAKVSLRAFRFRLHYQPICWFAWGQTMYRRIQQCSDNSYFSLYGDLSVWPIYGMSKVVLCEGVSVHA